MSFTAPPAAPEAPPPAPSRDDPVDEFDPKANRHVAWLGTFVAWLITFRTYLVTMVVELTASQKVVTDAASASQEDAGKAHDSELAAGRSAGAAHDSELAAGRSSGAAHDSELAAGRSAGAAHDSELAAGGSAGRARDSELAAAQSFRDAKAQADRAGLPFTGTSATGIKVEQGDVAFVTQTGLGFVPGQRYSLARTSVPSVAMFGAVKTYNAATGAFTGTRDRADGAGTFTDWTVALGGASGASGTRPTVMVTADMVAAAGNDYVFKGNYLLTIPAALLLNDTFGFSNGTGLAGPRIDFGTTKVKGRTPGVVTMTRANAATVVKFTADADVGFTEV